MRVEIVKALPKDAREFIEYTKQVGSETDNLTFGKKGLPISIEEEEKQIEEWNNSFNNLMLLAKRNGRIIGNANLRGFSKERLSHRGELGITVLKSEWGKGIGSLLIENIITFAKESNIKVISLEVRSDNKRAIHLYEKYGFVKIGHFKDFFIINGKGIDCELMNLYL